MPIIFHCSISPNCFGQFFFLFFQLLNLFNYHLQKMEESGIIERLNRVHRRALLYEKDRNMDCPKEEGLGFKSTISSFLILVVGAGISLLAFMFEAFYYKYKRSRII